MQQQHKYGRNDEGDQHPDQDVGALHGASWLGRGAGGTRRKSIGFSGSGRSGKCSSVMRG